MDKTEAYIYTISNPVVYDIVMLHRWQKWQDNIKLHKGAARNVQMVIAGNYTAEALHAARKILADDPAHHSSITATPYFRDVSIPERVTEHLKTLRRNAADPLGVEIARQAAADAELAAIAARRAREHDAERHRLERVLAKRRRADRGPVAGTFSLLVIAGGLVVDRLHGLDQAEAMELLSARQAGESGRMVRVGPKVTLPGIGEPYRPEGALLGKFGATVAAARASAVRSRGVTQPKASAKRIAALAS